MERYRLSSLMRDIEMGGDIDVVIAADAQATVEALQAQLREGEAAYHNVGEYNDHLKQQVEALQRERDHAKKMEAVQKEVADNQTWHVRELRAALDAEREKVKGLEQEAERLRIVNRGHINEGFKDMKTIEELTAAFAKAQAQLSQLQALVRAYFTEPDPHKWTAAYQTLKRMGRALPATPTEELNHPAQPDSCQSKKGAT